MLKKNFSDFNLSPELQKAVARMGFEEATPIQSLVIEPILQGRDIIGQAQTGTGKTAAFGLPILERIDGNAKGVQALILCPTRELAVQIAEELTSLSQFQKDIRVLPVYGGQPIERQFIALKRGVHVVVGTPGRIRDHMERTTLRLDNVSTVVLDEADEMLDMGFIDEMRFILGHIPNPHQTLLFSATIPKTILELSRAFQSEPEVHRVVHEDLTVPGVEQTYFEVKEHQKAEILSRLIDIHDLKLTLVFCNTKRRVDELASRLQARGYAASALHGDMSQKQRERVMSQFRNGGLEILVATDVAARGIDVDDIEVVVNYDVPRDEEYYVHRIGRTARAGKTGRAFTFVSGKEQFQLAEIQKYAKTRIHHKPLPSLDDVEEIRAGAFQENVRRILSQNDLSKYRSLVEKLMQDDFTSLEVAAAVLKLYLEKDAKTTNGNDSKPAMDKSEMTRLILKLGRNHRIKPGDIVGAIAGETELPGNRIGSIVIHDHFSFVEVPLADAESVMRRMNKAQIKGHPVKIEATRR